MGNVRPLTHPDDATVQAFLKLSAGASIYHSPRWRDVITSTYGYEPKYLGHFEGDDLTAYLPLMLVRSWLTGRRLVSLPFANACGALGDPAGIAALLDRALAIRTETDSRALEIRTQADINPTRDARFSKMTYFVTSIVDLESDPDVLWRRFTKDSGVRTEVRQAERKGVRVFQGGGIDDLMLFYRLFVMLRLKHGVPPQSPGFFVNLWRNLWPDHMTLWLAAMDSRPVGGLITLGMGRTACAAYIGSDIRFRHYRVHQALIWHAIEMACRKGYATFDFLRSPRKSQQLRYFKERWDAREVDLEYLYYPEVRGTASTVEDSAKYRMMTAVLRRSPAVVARIAGKMLYKHMG